MMNEIRREAQRAVDKTGRLQYGIVTAVDPTRHAAKVQLQPDNIESGWLPSLATLAAGTLRITVPPEIGAHVIVGSIEGDAEALAIVGLAFDDALPASISPITKKPAQPGELLIMGGQGAPPFADTVNKKPQKSGKPQKNFMWWHFMPTVIHSGAGDMHCELTAAGETITIGDKLKRVLTKEGETLMVDKMVAVFTKDGEKVTIDETVRELTKDSQQLKIGGMTATFTENELKIDGGNLEVAKNTTIHGDLRVDGKASVGGDMSVSGKLSVGGNISANSSINASGSIKANGEVEGSEVTAGGVTLSKHTHSAGECGTTGPPEG